VRKACNQREKPMSKRGSESSRSMEANATQCLATQVRT